MRCTKTKPEKDRRKKHRKEHCDREVRWRRLMVLHASWGDEDLFLCKLGDTKWEWLMLLVSMPSNLKWNRYFILVVLRSYVGIHFAILFFCLLKSSHFTPIQTIVTKLRLGRKTVWSPCLDNKSKYLLLLHKGGTWRRCSKINKLWHLLHTLCF